MQQVLDLISKLFTEIADLKNQLLQQETSSVSPDWVPKKILMRFLDYGDTQIAALLNSGELDVVTIGKRKFIHRDSITKFLEKNRK
ncbi:helix-turn-helix domain-containing protein [Flavisolibacter tropicus]|nr:helix-turn-helix domain-containing protein [Flavisolibacter tropicus]